MKQDEEINQARFGFLTQGSWGWKVGLSYDIFMMVLIVINLFCLSANAILMSDFGGWLFNFIHLPELLQFYRTALRPWVIITESWFTSFLVIELILRWIIAILGQHHRRWFFFPFIHWYEILSVIPQLRFLRLLRAGSIAYKLYQHGYKVIPDLWYQRAHFYYHMLLEELTSRIVITVLDGIKRELLTSTTHRKLIEDLVAHHRKIFADALTDILQESLGKELQAQRISIAKNVGHIVNQAIEDTPELTQLLRLIPLVGGRIEQQIQSIGQRLGENITQGLIQPFTQNKTATENPLYREIAQKVSDIALEKNPYVEKLVVSAVFDSLEAVRQQVKVKQWQQLLDQHDQAESLILSKNS